MAEEQKKRGRGRPRKVVGDIPVPVRLPRHNYDYLVHLVGKGRLAPNVAAAATHILIRELDAMFKAEYHLKEIPPNPT